MNNKMKRPDKKDYLFAGHLIDPLRMGPTASEQKYEERDVDVMLSLLKRNKVPLITFTQEQKEAYPWLFETPQYKEQYEDEHSLYNKLREEWAKIRGEFLKAGIENMFIKSVGLFDYKSSNLDILIKQGKRSEAESILLGMGYVQLHNVEEPFKTLFRLYEGGKSYSVIHLHNKVAWINPFHDEKLLWSRYSNSSTDDLVDIPSPEDSILILTAHWFYEDKEITLSDIIKTSACLKRKDLDWNYMKAVAKRLGWLNGLYCGLLVQSFLERELYGASLIENERLEMMKASLPRWMINYLNKSVYSRRIELPFQLPKMFGKYLHFVKTMKDKTTIPSEKIKESYAVLHASIFVVLFYKFNINIRYQPSMLISISGVDGSGKSTYAENINNTFDFCELKKRYVWSRVGSAGFIKPLSRIAKGLYRLKKGKEVAISKGGYKEAEVRRKDLFGKSSVVRRAGLAILLAEMLLRYSLKVRLPLLFNKVVICDRYIYDTLIDITTRYDVDLDSKEGKIFAKVLSRLSPKPDIAYVLTIPYEDACSRRGAEVHEGSVAKEQIDLYQAMASKYNLHHINTGSGTCIKTISDKMIYDILASYYNKWPIKKRPRNF